MASDHGPGISQVVGHMIGSRPSQVEGVKISGVTSTPIRSQSSARDPIAAEQVVAYVRGLIVKGELRPGDRLASERELVSAIGGGRARGGAGARARAAGGV